MSKQVMQRALDALWVATEHNALHFDENHNTVVQGRSDIAELRAEIVKPEVEPVAWTVTEMDSVITNDDKQTNAIQFSQRYLDMHDIPLYTAQPDTEAMRRDAAKWKRAAEYWYGEFRHAKIGAAEYQVLGALDAWFNSTFVAIDKQGDTT